MKILLRGMHGLGDCIHQRAVVRELIRRNYQVYLETPWPQLYYDMPIKIYLPEKTLRTQKKNCEVLQREYQTITPEIINRFPIIQKIWYTGEQVRQYGFVGAMFNHLQLFTDDHDFSIDTKKFPAGNFKRLITDKPIMVYRPLITRTEWDGCENRNPDKIAYNTLFNTIRDKYYVVSVADLIPGVEWITSTPVRADMQLHNGGLSVVELLALFAMADLVYCSPGFALPMAQAVGTKVICVYGGRENSKQYTQNDKTLGVDTIKPCSCFDHRHDCVKTIDITGQAKRIHDFVGSAN